MKINGLKVVDVRKKLAIAITPKDINAAKKTGRKDPGACAAALAAMRQLHVTEAKVQIGRTYIMRGKKWERYFTPDALRSEIVAFDRGGDFEPGIYTLRPLGGTSQALGANSGSNTNRTTNKSTHTKRKNHITMAVRAIEGVNKRA